jgi:hypothetical protein
MCQRNLLEEIGRKQETSTVYQDNDSTTKIIESKKSHPGVKHVALRYHFIKEKKQDGTIKVIRKDTSEMTADIFTKALSYLVFIKHRFNLGLTCWRK